MSFINHCQLCEHQKVDFKIGTTCGLTNEKPKFDKKCSKIEINKRAKSKIREVNVNSKLIGLKKTKIQFHLVGYLTAGVLVIIGAFIFSVIVLELGFITTWSITLLGVGLSLISYAMKPFLDYRTDKSIALKKKNDVSGTLKQYSLDYLIAFKVKDEVYNSMDIITEIELKGRINRV